MKKHTQPKPPMKKKKQTRKQSSGAIQILEDDGRYPKKLFVVVGPKAGNDETHYYGVSDPRRLAQPGRYALVGVYKLAQTVELASELLISVSRPIKIYK